MNANYILTNVDKILDGSSSRSASRYVQKTRSRMTRLNTYLISLILVIGGCQEPSNESLYTSQNQIIGQFVLWGADNHINVYWQVQLDTGVTKLAESEISSDGSFVQPLPIPPNDLLRSYAAAEREDSIYVEMIDSVIFSDSSAKFTRFGLSYSGTITIGTSCGNVSQIDTSSQVGDYQIFYYYFDRPTQVSGNWRVHFYDGYSPNAGTFITQYNDVKFLKGWNQITLRLVGKNNDQTVYEIVNEDKLNTEWRSCVAFPFFARLL